MDTHTTEPMEAAIIINLPTYNPTNVPIWFAQLNAIFNAKKITSQSSKYAYVVEKLPADVASEVVDLLNDMPKEKPYDTLKAAIIRCVGKSEERRLHDLFNNVNQGYMKPSQLLRKMRSLLGDNTMSEVVLKKLWMDKLQTHTTQILASLPDDLQLEKIAEIADKIHDNNQDKNVYATSHAPTDTATLTDKSSELSQLYKQMANLSLQVQSLVQAQKSQRSCPTFRNRSYSPHRRRSRSNSFSREQITHDTCWYHYKFGRIARKCTEPCNFNSKTSRISTQHQGNDCAGSK